MRTIAGALIGLNDPDIERRREVAQGLKDIIGNRAKIYDTEDFDETVDILKRYSLYRRETRILIHPLQEIAANTSEGMWRAGEWFYARRGGILFGEDVRRENIAYRGPIPDDLQKMIDSAAWHWQRARYVKSAAPRVFGRAHQDPHTLILGYRPSWPRLAKSAEAMVAGLPADWWRGVAFFVPSSNAGADEELEQVFETYMYAQRVTVTKNAHAYLERMGEPHQDMDLPAPQFKDGMPKYTVYGNRIRELARLDGERVV